MFRPDSNRDRTDYSGILMPPDGYRLDRAVGTTYSLVLSAPFAPYPFGRWLLSALFRKKLKKAKCARPQDADGRKGNVSSS